MTISRVSLKDQKNLTLKRHISNARYPNGQRSVPTARSHENHHCVYWQLSGWLKMIVYRRLPQIRYEPSSVNVNFSSGFFGEYPFCTEFDEQARKCVAENRARAIQLQSYCMRNRVENNDLVGEWEEKTRRFPSVFRSLLFHRLLYGTQNTGSLGFFFSAGRPCRACHLRAVGVGRRLKRGEDDFFLYFSFVCGGRPAHANWTKREKKKIRPSSLHRRNDSPDRNETSFSPPMS